MDLAITIFLYVLLGLVIFAALARAILLIVGGLAMMKTEKHNQRQNDASSSDPTP